MSQSKVTESPFQSPLEQQQVKLSFSLLMVLLLMVVGAGAALLVFFAMRVPAITNELNSWLGRTAQEVDVKDARRAQLVFAMYVYCSPLALGMLVYGLHILVNLFEDRAKVESPEDDPFRMEWDDSKDE